MFGRKSPEQKAKEKEWQERDRQWKIQERKSRSQRDRIIEELYGREFLIRLPCKYSDVDQYVQGLTQYATPLVFGKFTCHVDDVFVKDDKASISFWISTSDSEYDFHSFYVKNSTIGKKISISHERIEDWKVALVQELDRITIDNTMAFEKIQKLNAALINAITENIEASKLTPKKTEPIKSE